MKSKRCKLLERTISILLILLHLITFGPVRDALAFSAQSQSYKLSAGALNEGGRDRANISAKLWQDSLGEPAIGKAASASYSLNAGLIAILQTNPPALTLSIPYQSWLMDTAKANAFDLDDYFSSDIGALSYTVSGNAQITVSIDSNTHSVSFSQPGGFFGVEEVYFTATDSEGNSTQGNKVTLQVENPQGPDRPVIVEVLVRPQTIQEGDLVKLIIKAKDLDNDPITFSYNQLFAQTNTYQLNGYWYSEGLWQTSANSKGHYPITITAKDTNNLSDTETLTLNLGNFNHPPQLLPLSPVTAFEGDLVVLSPQATDPDNDSLSFYYTYPFDSTGKWLTDYNDEGTSSIKVTASDGIDTVFQDVLVTILKTNQSPQVNLSLSKYTVLPNEEITISLSASDPDSDAMSFSLKKDGLEIALGSLDPQTGSLANPQTFTTSFSTIGDHSISATVTDSGGLSTSTTQAIDVVDPNTNRDSTNPVMGDFNGDALSDLGLHNSDTGTWEVALSNKGVFTAALDWLTNFGTTKDWWPIGGDFNGDAKTDIGIHNNTSGELKIALSTGSSFSVSGIGLSFSSASFSWQPFTGNFNADKYTDFALYNKDSGEVRVALGTATGFQAFTTWLNDPSAKDYIALSGDFNGDSLSDLGLFKKSSGEVKVVFSNSQGFVDANIWITGFAANQDLILSDFNNDGLTDIGYWDKTNWYYARSTGEKFIDQGIFISNFGSASDESATTADFDGNGLTDLAVFDQDQIGIQRWKTKLSALQPADLLTEIDNGIGGKTQVTYTYAATSDNPELPFPVYVASQVKLIDTLPTNQPQESYTQSFIFFGGYYDAAEREFRGFAKVKVTDPITKNFSETYFYQGKPGQDGALKGQIEKVISYDGNSKKISETLNTYEVRKSGTQTNVLGAAFLIAQETAVWEENATSLTTKSKFSYDNIGNLLEERQEGDVTKTGDEKLAQTTYAPAYELGFNRPLEVSLKDKDANVLSQKTFEYDTKGNLIKEKAFIFNPFSADYGLPTTDYAYDSFGNLISSTNGLGATVTTDYETDFYTYPQRITNALGQTISYTYNPKFGVVIQVTDANGITTGTTYDSLGRVVRVTNDDGGGTQVTAAAYSYPDFNTKVSTNAIGLSATEYIDGLARRYKSVSIGEDGSIPRKISSETYFNNRGQVEKESLAHYLDEDSSNISYIRYEYDIRGRLKKTTSDFPGLAKDASSTIEYKSPLETETTDPQGHRKGTKKDVYGNILEVIEYAATDGVFHTYYTYDLQGNLIKTKDNQGNITQIFYDSLGRKLKMIDPDMGEWSYEYDLLGHLIKQTDAKAQTLEFSYDVLNRLIKKSSLRGSEAAEAILAEYLYDDPAKSNCIGRLSKVTDQSGSSEFFYDTLGREVKSTKSLRGNETTEAITYTVQREYDVLDRLTKLTYPDEESVSYSYDANSGLLESVSLRGAVGDEAISIVNTISYNASGQIKTMQYGNSVTTNYTYGQDLRLSRILTRSPAHPQTLQDLNYQFDKNGNLETLTDNLRSNIRSYSYDNLDRLTQADNIPDPNGGYTIFSYQYDSIGNMIYKSDAGVMSYGVNAGPHALTLAGGYSYTYDANGNMVSGKNKTMEYDAENRLTKVIESTQTTSFTYDGDGGRVKKGLSPQGTVSEQWTTYIGSLFEIQSVVSSPKSVVKHIFAGSQRICSVTTDYGLSTTGYHYYHTDHLGSSNVITNGTGALVQRIEYTPYGSIASTEPSTLNPVPKYLFTGKELDATGLYFYGARYYDPEIGRFITADTIVQSPYDPQSLNRYSYVRNNPINYTDPTGNFWFIPLLIGIVKGALIGAAIGAAVAAATGSNIWQGALTGAISGAIFGGIGSFGLKGAAHTLAHTLGGAASGAANGSITGGDIGMNALIGAVSAGGSEWLGTNVDFLKPVGGNGPGAYINNMLRRTFVGSVMGGATSAAMGGSFGYGARQGAITSAIAYTTNDWLHDVTEKLDFVKKGKELVPQAFEDAKESKLPGDTSGPQDAYRHARWNELMRKEMGPLKAFIVSMSHEIFENQVTGEQSWNDFRMDTHNNFQGAFSGKDAMTLYGEGKLKVLKNPTSEYKSSY